MSNNVTTQFNSVAYVGTQGTDGIAPGSGVLSVIEPNSGRYFEVTHYQYGATLKHDGQLLECFIGADTGGTADLSVRGVVEHRGARLHARNGRDTFSACMGVIDDRAAFYLHGATADMPVDLRIGHERTDGAFSFVTGMDNYLTGGTEVARISDKGLCLKQRDSAPTPPEGYTVLWAKTDGTVQSTANVGGTVTTTQL